MTLAEEPTDTVVEPCHTDASAWFIHLTRRLEALSRLIDVGDASTLNKLLPSPHCTFLTSPTLEYPTHCTRRSEALENLEETHPDSSNATL